jgi:ABC-type branched-subunit amino acid transport system substrate-binding protein
MRQTTPSCLVNGNHTPGSEWERECPLNPNRAEDRRIEKERRLQAASPAQRAAWAAGARRFASVTSSRIVDQSARDAVTSTPEAADQGVDTGLVENPPASPHQSGRFGQVDVTRQSEQIAHKGGRPRKHQDRQAAHREAQRAYRDRARGAQ